MEVTKALYLSDKEQSMLDMHSMLNIINVIIGELTLLQMDLPNDPHVKAVLKEANNLKSTLNKKDRTNFTEKVIKEFRNNLNQAVDHIEQPLTEAKGASEYEHFKRNMNNILSIMDVRVDELLARWKFPDQWLTFTEDQLRKEITDFLSAMELNSRGRYRMVYNGAENDKDTYLIHLDVNGSNNELKMPYALKDVLRDLVANARKYTEVGGKIDIAVHENDHKLRMIVEDNGAGIPQSDIEKIFDFGERGSNTEKQRTMGGSFGLTKALLTTRHYHGRMWIDSTVGQGTKITIEVPVY